MDNDAANPLGVPTSGPGADAVGPSSRADGVAWVTLRPEAAAITEQHDAVPPPPAPSPLIPEHTTERRESWWTKPAFSVLVSVVLVVFVIGFIGAVAQLSSVKSDRDEVKQRLATVTRERDDARAAARSERVYAVGSDMQPGTWRTAGASGCYYAILNSTDTTDIADNNNTDGPATVTLAPGKYFDVNGCADWTKIG